MRDDCSCMAHIYRWLIWASRNARAEAPETDRSTAEDEKKGRVLRSGQTGPCEAELASAVHRASRPGDAAGRLGPSATISFKAQS